MPCYSPISIRDKTDKMYRAKTHIVPCGYCYGCLLERSRSWAVRCLHESKCHEKNSFITLTISPENLVYGGSEYATLVPEDLQLFFKRLRKALSKASIQIRHFSCGEYGDNSYRPHYHSCIFGYDFPDKKLYNIKRGNNYYVSEMLNKTWGLGNCIIGDFSFETAAYVARYCLKKSERTSKKEYEEKGVVPEFSRMSLRPAIGLRYFEKFEKDFFCVSDSGEIINDTCVVRGVRQKSPRYYFKKFSEKNIIDSKILLDTRKESAYINGQYNSRRLKDAEKVKLAQTQSLARQI